MHTNKNHNFFFIFLNPECVSGTTFTFLYSFCGFSNTPVGTKRFKGKAHKKSVVLSRFYPAPKEFWTTYADRIYLE